MRWLILICLLYGCGLTEPQTVWINKDAPAGSTQKVTIVKINPVFYTGETIILATDRNNKETHYTENHTDLGMITSILSVLAGVAIGAS